MTYDLFIGDRMFSSWSLRGWLLLEKFGIPYRIHKVGLYSGRMAEEMAPLAPARLVPSLRLPPEGVVISESLAIAETLAERHPEAGIWPTDGTARAVARWLCAEMVSGFFTLREKCPMQLHCIWEGFSPSQTVCDDLARLETLWSHARKISGAKRSWLFGKPSAADAFFAPVAARIIGYDLPVSDDSRAYCQQLLSDPAVRQWRTDALEEVHDPLPHDQNLPRLPWPDL